jgi:formylglycine-generating enzyme required for sulfatase activity
VTLTKGFWMGVTPVTQAQWRAVLGSNPSYFKGDDRPVESVSWDDCQAFCRGLGRRTGKPVRLPMEAEWEYACRAGTATAYPGGDGEQALQGVGWYRANSGGQTQPVGRKAPNAFGLYDLHGNVWEWCADRPADEGHGQGESSGPADPRPGLGRVLRGGSWFNKAAFCRAACRYYGGPASRANGCGARVCLLTG